MKNLIILNKTGEPLEINVKEENTILELKKQIKRKMNLNIDLFYLYYNNVNLISYYDNYTIAKLIKEYSKKGDSSFEDNQEQEEYLYLISSEGKKK